MISLLPDRRASRCSGVCSCSCRRSSGPISSLAVRESGAGEYRRAAIVNYGMRQGDGHALRIKIGIVVSIAVALFVVTVRPVTRPYGRLERSLGLTRLSLLSEPPLPNDTTVPSPATHLLPLVALALLQIFPRLVLKRRRAAFCSVPILRLKLPPSSPSGSVSSH